MIHSLGSYIHGNSRIHRLDPRVKITAVFLLSFVVFQSGGYGLLAASIFLVLSLAAARLSFRAAVKSLKPMFWFFALIFLLNVFLTEGRQLIPLVTYEGLHKGALLTWQFAVLVMIASLLTVTTTQTELVCGIERLLRPLRRLGVSSHDAAVMISLSLRFVPLLLEETARIRDAHLARGAALTGGPALRRFKAVISLAIPFMIQILRRSEELATAMEGRGYQRGPRTYLHELHFTPADYAALTVTASFAAALQVLNILY
ncbi:MAG: energy-coupling factor transporter transmembrane protein EcfT [Syntrophales bacterium]